MTALRATISPEAIRRVNERAKREPARVFKALKGTLNVWGQRLDSKMQDRMRGEALSRRTGALARSFGHEVTGSNLSDLRMRAFTKGVVYARIHEHGGVIKPVNAKFLTIPLQANKTAAGVARFPSAREFINTHKGETFFLRTEAAGRDRLLLMWSKPGARFKKASGVKGKGSAIPMFLLVKSVKLKPRLGYFDTWRAQGAERKRDLERLAATLGAA